MHRIVTSVVLAICIGPSVVHASVVEMEDRSEWESAVGHFTTLDFVLPPSGTPINNQYGHLGVQVTGLAFSHWAGGTYPNDEWGLQAKGGAWLHFDEPQHWVAIDFAGTAQIKLYSRGELIHTTDFFSGSGVGNFGGVISTIGFDEIYLFRITFVNHVFIDDVHFGTFIPAPGTLGLLALGALSGARRQRRKC